jgi:hypothetical protein
LRLTLNLAQLAPDSRDQAVADLQEVMDRIRQAT